MDWKVPPYDIEEIRADETPFPRFLEDDSAVKIEYVLIGLPDSLQEQLTKVNLEQESSKIYSPEELDRMPLFDETCASSDDPMKCSYDKAAAFFAENLAYPEQALEQEQEGLVRLVFVINEDGWVEDKIKVIKGDKPCKGCAKAAIETAYNMPAWRPAMSKGKKVKALVTLPIRFETKPLYENR